MPFYAIQKQRLNDAPMDKNEQTTKEQIKNKFIGRLITEFLDIIIMAHFENDPFCGYKILQHVQHLFGVRLSSGTVYSTIYSMERKNLLSGVGLDGKRIYRVTNKGKLYLSAALSPEETAEFMAKAMNTPLRDKKGQT
jgi:DNA-binding PadR family transcriptional regulator